MKALTPQDILSSAGHRHFCWPTSTSRTRLWSSFWPEAMNSDRAASLPAIIGRAMSMLAVWLAACSISSFAAMSASSVSSSVHVPSSRPRQTRLSACTRLPSSSTQPPAPIVWTALQHPTPPVASSSKAARRSWRNKGRRLTSFRR